MIRRLCTETVGETQSSLEPHFFFFLFSSRVNCFVQDLLIPTTAELHPVLTAGSDPSLGPCCLLLVLQIQKKQEGQRHRHPDAGTARGWKDNLAVL